MTMFEESSLIAENHGASERDEGCWASENEESHSEKGKEASKCRGLKPSSAMETQLQPEHQTPLKCELESDRRSNLRNSTKNLYSYKIIRKKAKVSDFKNLGKAFIKMLRRIIAEQHFPSDGETAETIKQLWAVFKKSVPNITMASAVLGSIEGFSYQALIKLGLKRVITKKTPEEIRRAQKCIRIGIVDQLSSIDVDEEIDKSKVTAKDKFKKYMHGRIDEMKRGTFKQRISLELYGETKYNHYV